MKMLLNSLSKIITSYTDPRTCVATPLQSPIDRRQSLIYLQHKHADRNMADFRASSPTSDIFSDEADAVSIRDKTLLKRSVSKHHNNNFKAGYVPVHEQHLAKTGLRGRKTFYFWTLVILLFILAVGNLILTITILGVLRLGQGMESVEVVPDEYAIKFFGETDLGYMYKRDGRIEGFKDDPLEISGVDNAIVLNLNTIVGRPPKSKLTINKTETVLQGFQSFEIKNKQGETLLSANAPQFKSLKGANSFRSANIETNRIVSPVKSNLKIEGKFVSLKGSEGTTMDGKEIIWSADEDIYLKTDKNGSVILSNSDGTYINVRRIPINANLRSNNYHSAQYKVCVCMPQGKLFRIPVQLNSRAYCHHINTSGQQNPCM